MESFVLSLIRSFIIFGRNLVGVFNNPYVTYRKLTREETDLKQTVFIPLLVILYFAFVSALRVGVRNPFLITVKFNLLLLASVAGFAGILVLFYIGGSFMGGKGSIKQIYTLWIFSLIPTLVWFFATSILYLILPPPRTLSFAGKLYSVVYIAFSIATLLWKTILYYLTLRFSLKLDLSKIMKLSFLIVMFIYVYSILMYKWGIFRIPFI